MEQAFRAALKEFQKDLAFVKRATDASKNLTSAFNASRLALADVGLVDHQLVHDLIKKRPTYVPTDRVRQDIGWKHWFSRRGEQMLGPIKKRTGSGEQLVDPYLSYQNRLRVTAHLLSEQLRRKAVYDVAKKEGMGKWMLEVPRPMEKYLVNTDKLVDVLRDMGVNADDIKEIVDLIGPGAGSYFTPAKWAATDKPMWIYIDKGEPKYFRVGDRALYDVLTNQQADSNAFIANFLKPLSVVFSPFAKFQRFGATTASHLFQARNISPFRDPAEFLKNTTSEKGFIKNVGDLTKMYGAVYAHAWKELIGTPASNPAVELYHEAGGRGLRQFAMGGKNPERAYREAMGHETTLGRIGGAIIDNGKAILEVMGAGEHGPRALEFKNYLDKAGYTRDVIEKNLKSRPDQDPVPFSVLVSAMNAAAEVTVPFARKGIVTREINRSIAFFGPHVSGLLKELRNVREMPKRAATALAAYLALETLHWFTYKDDDWYQELDSNTRAAYFVVPMPWGKLWYIPKPRGVMNHVSELFQEGLRFQSDSNPKFKEWVGQTAAGLTPPLLPQPAAAAKDVLTNRAWTGAPIVPRAEQDLPDWAKFTTHQAPYAVDQITGGLLSTHRARVNPFGRQSEPHSSTTDFYERLNSAREDRASSGFKAKESATQQYNEKLAALEAKRGMRDYPKELKVLQDEMAKAKREGRVLSPLDEAQFQRTEFYASLMSKIRQTVTGETDRDKLNETSRYINGLARAALGEKDLGMYPNVLKDRSALPPGVRLAAEQAISQLLNRATAPVPIHRLVESNSYYSERRQKHDQDVQNARALLQEVNLGYAEARRLLVNSHYQIGPLPRVMNDNGTPSEFGRRLDRLRILFPKMPAQAGTR